VASDVTGIARGCRQLAVRAAAQPGRALLDHGARHRGDRAASAVLPAIHRAERLALVRVAEADVAGLQLDRLLAAERDRPPGELQIDRKVIDGRVVEVAAAANDRQRRGRFRHQEAERARTAQCGAGRERVELGVG